MDDLEQDTGDPRVQARAWHQGHLGLKPEAGRDLITKSFVMRAGV